jgi:hypothetical protein
MTVAQASGLLVPLASRPARIAARSKRANQQAGRLRYSVDALAGGVSIRLGRRGPGVTARGAQSQCLNVRM